MDRSKLSSLLEEIALYMELLGENPFKVRAHQNAARIIETSSEDIEKRINDNTLGEIKGIGPALKEKIEEFHKTGELREHYDLLAKIPPGLLQLIKIPGLGPKKARIIYEKLGVKSVGELEYACRENRLAKLSGFGEKTQVKILKNIEFMKRYQDKFLYSDAFLEAHLLISYLQKLGGVKDISVVGALRRKLEVVSGIGVLISSDLKETGLKDLFKGCGSYPGIEKDTFKVAGSEASFNLECGIPCKVKTVDQKAYPLELLNLTGSGSHVEELKRLALDKGIPIDKPQLSSENEIYKNLGLCFVEPELREGAGELEAAASNSLPQLVERSQLKGIFHCHTTASDGVNSLEEMVAAAQDLGFEYIGISDHSASSVAYANGLVKTRVLEQLAQIEELQKKFKIKIFKGIESDILSDGSLDYEEDILKKFDFVIGSVHSGFTQSKDQMTKRVLKAVSNPYLDFLGHPTGRLLLAREGFEIDLHKVIEAASQVGVAVEVNASPHRLDLDWRYGKFLKGKKGIVSINPDAHSIAGLEDVEFGIGIARKGWLTAENVVNTLPSKNILGSLRRARGQRI